ncbi:MAPEG family protein [Salipiger pallidus]|nr:MAPEG family protein [Salipiger pallidus]
MTPELTVLILATLLQLLQMALFSVLAQKQVGRRYAMSPRDEGRQLSGMAGRAHRAMNNHFEGLILFGIAALTVSFADAGSAVTALAAGIYLLARILYVPAYLFGWTPWRSLIWIVGLAATATMLIAALL